MEKTKRIVYLEKIRVFAMWMVLYVHSGTTCVRYYENASTTLGYWVSLFMVPVTQCCVMLFFMISGALLLHRQESLKELYLHRVIPTAIVLVLAGLLQYLQNCFSCKVPFSFASYVEIMYSGGPIAQHWFLYAYLCFLMILPFLRAMVKGLEGNGWYRYLLALMFLLNTLCPMWEAVSDWGRAGLSVPLLTEIIFYPLMGHYMERSGDGLLENKKLLAAADLTAVALAVCNTLMNRHSLVLGGKVAYPAVFLFYFTCVLFWNFKLLGNGSRGAAFWCFAGSGVFGTYLFEPQLRNLLEPLVQFFSGQRTPYLLNLFGLLLMEILGILLANLLKRIPGVRKLL